MIRPGKGIICCVDHSYMVIRKKDYGWRQLGRTISIKPSEKRLLAAKKHHFNLFVWRKKSEFEDFICFHLLIIYLLALGHVVSLDPHSHQL